MAILSIEPQVQESSRFEASIILEGRRYGLRWYNLGAQLPYWCFDVFEADNPTANVLTGIRVSVGVDLRGRYPIQRVELLPPGILFCQDNRRPRFNAETQAWEDQPGFDPSETSFADGTHVIMYMESQDVVLP